MSITKVIVYLNDTEKRALFSLAEREYRDPRAQAALVIRRELERRGLIKPIVMGVVDEQRAAGAAGNSNILKQGAKDMSNLQQVDVQVVGGVSDPPPAEEATEDVDVSAGEERTGVNIDDHSPLDVFGDAVETSAAPEFSQVVIAQKASVKPFESR